MMHLPQHCQKFPDNIKLLDSRTCELKMGMSFVNYDILSAIGTYQAV